MTPCCLLFSNQLVESLSQHQSVATLVLDRAENITDATLVELVVPLAAGWSVILPSAGRYDPACLSHWGLFHNHVVCTFLTSLLCVSCKKNFTIRPRTVVPENYVKEIRPPSRKGEPVLVEFSIYVVDINSINVEDMDFRSRVPSPALPDFSVKQWLWNGLELSLIATLTHKFSSVTLFRNKTVRYAARMHAIIACQMEFQLYPMDIQVCPMYIESFSYNHQKLQLHWSKDGVTVNPELKLLQYNMGQPLKLEETTGYMQEKEGEGRYSTTNPGTTGYMQEKEGTVLPTLELQGYMQEKESTVLPTLELQVTCRRRKVQYYQPWNYRLHAGEGRYSTTNHGTTGYMQEKGANFSRLIMYFRFERQIGHHLIQTFAPSSLVVMLSWFSFWLGLDAIPGRVTLLVTSMLTLVTMFTGLKTDIPPVAYVKALDLWMAGCMVFVFAALGEFVVVKVLDVRYQLDKETRVATLPRILPMRIHALDKPHCMTAWDVEGVRCRKPSLSFRNRGLVKLAWVDRATGQEKILWQEIDRQSRVMFPVLFLVFVVFYWPILLLKKS
uniref:Uncharacterized protein n=1 Tax=Timema tahoe TaxID=61484 RepID=A0A7R9NYR9_9NEOP|nr:unnamed protein product [Timema tahoe]